MGFEIVSTTSPVPPGDRMLTAAGTDTAATRMGADRTWRLCAGLYLAVGIVAVGSLVGMRGRGAGLIAAVAGCACVVAGLVSGRSDGPMIRERAWELEAVGVGLLAAGWVAAIAEAGSL